MLYITIFTKLFLGLIGLLIVVRLVGKRSFSQITPYDLVYTLILGGIIAPALYNPEIHVGYILYAMAVWGILIYIIEVLVQKNKLMTRKIKGKPSVLIQNGELNLKEIWGNHIEMEQLRALLREQGYFSLRDIEFAVLEINGVLSVIPKEEVKPYPSYFIIDGGKIQKYALQSIQKETGWLLTYLDKNNYALKEIVYGEWSKRDGFYLKKYSDSKEEAFRLDN